MDKKSSSRGKLPQNSMESPRAIDQSITSVRKPKPVVTYLEENIHLGMDSNKRMKTIDAQPCCDPLIHPPTASDYNISGTYHGQATNKKADDASTITEIQQCLPEEPSRCQHCWESDAWVYALKSNVRELSENLARTQSELSACKDDLMRQQPYTQISDSVIEKEFDRLCYLVSDWVIDEMETFESRNPRHGVEELFATDPHSKLGRHLDRYPGASEQVAKYYVHQQLVRLVFAEDLYLVGLSPGFVKALQKAETSMSFLEPPRAAPAIAKWRSETLTALAATDLYESSLTDVLKTATIKMFRNLQQLLPVIFGNKESMASFYTKVMIPAGQLAKTVQTSTNKYQFTLPDDPFLIWAKAQLEDLQDCSMIDLETSRVIKSESQLNVVTKGVIGKALMPVEPGIRREVREGEDVIVRKMLWLVRLERPAK